MARIAVSNRVIARSSIGQFISECSMAASKSIDTMLEEGVKIADDLAPTGHKEDPRTATLHASFFTHKLSRTSGIWGNDARHALPIEFGAGPHLIPGSPWLSFFWEEAGRRWVPGLYGKPDIVNHPGNAAQPYLRPSYEAVMASAMAIMKRYYPG